MRDSLLADLSKKIEGIDNSTFSNKIISGAETAITPDFYQSLNNNEAHSHQGHSHNHHDNDHNNNNNEEMPLTITSTATKKLTLVCCVCSVFMLIEFFGGLLSDSIAIMTDAAHLLSDLAGFLISIYALYISNKKPDANFTFGYHRAEIVGAVASVFIIWILTSLLLVESIARLFDSHHYVNGKIMLITSSIGLVFNGVMAYVLHSGGEGGHHHHGHNCSGGEQVHSLLKKDEHHHHEHNHDHGHEHNHGHEKCSHEHHEHNIIFEDFNEDGGSLNENIKGKTTNTQKMIEMNQIDQIRKISDLVYKQSQFSQIQKEMNKTFDENDLRNKKKESQVINRNNIQSDFEDIDQDHFKKRKSENITLRSKKISHYNVVMGSPHVSKQLTRDHSKLHKLGAFIGLIEHDAENDCSKNSDDHHEVSFHTISFNDSPKENNHDSQGNNNNSNQREGLLVGHSHNHTQHKHSCNSNNINVQAAFIHIIGDIIQSIGVIIAASLIYFFPTYQIIDPLTTILFSIIVVTTTIPIIKQCVYAIMEGNTNVEDFTIIKNELLNLPGVISVCCFHLYYLSLDKAVLCAHIKVIQSVSECDLLNRVYAELNKYKIYHCTIEISKEDSNTCSNMMEIV